jgi:hypothetical protein
MPIVATPLGNPFGVPASNASKFSVSKICEQCSIARQDTFDFKYDTIEAAGIIVMQPCYPTHREECGRVFIPLEVVILQWLAVTVNFLGSIWIPGS